MVASSDLPAGPTPAGGQPDYGADYERHEYALQDYGGDYGMGYDHPSAPGFVPEPGYGADPSQLPAVGAYPPPPGPGLSYGNGAGAGAGAGAGDATMSYRIPMPPGFKPPLHEVRPFSAIAGTKTTLDIDD